MPKYLTWVVVHSRFLHNVSLRSVSNCLFLGLNKITFVFATFNDILFAFNQRESCFKCLLSVLLICFMKLRMFNKQVSSAK